MEFRILGPVQVYDECTGVLIVPSGAKQRALLGALVVKAGQVVPAERLVDELWGQCPPANAANALQAHVARLRRLLPCGEPGSGRPHHEWLVTRPLGYALRLGDADTDAGRFRRLAAHGRELARDDPGAAAGVLRQALALWQGPALQGSGQGTICAAEAALLEENRLVALETLYDASLLAGHCHEVTGELEELVVAHPLRERFYELLMTALHRCGRQAEALGTYDRARRRLAHDLGIEPGPALRSRMESVLRRQDPAGAAEGAARAVAGPATGTGPVDEARTADDAVAGAVSVRMLGEELARLRGHVDRLTREHRELAGRLDRLTSSPVAGPRDLAS
ncbi:AfsR/SARP family transcriptional regulator [Streptomyces rochei]|uniref:AfsR/SARP family transcriptional regulator n=2 Tax=Streptomyces TaxID=1883 RepID=UPI002810CCF8|nr:AfsR/SARP family transcriptional regulator [Streptomyces sp.]